MLTDEQLEIQALARDFAEGELRPHTARWDDARELDDAVFAKLAELGFLGMRIPESHGGLGLDWSTYLLVLEELSWGDAAVGLAVSVHNGPVAELLLAFGTDAQKQRWLPKLASGELLGAFALSEPGAGSDPASLRTVARRGPGGWKLDGEKRFVTNGGRAGLVAVFARTDRGGSPDSGAAPKVGCFLVELPQAGYRAGEREKTMGLRASETVSVNLDGVSVPDDAVLGDPAAGLRQAMLALDVGRAGIGAQAVGIARAALEHATAYALEREQFNHPIADFGAIQEKLAEMAARVEGARALVHSAGSLLGARAQEGRPLPAGDRSAAARAAMAKLLASRTAMWVTDEAVQIFGGYGYMRDYPVEKLMRDAKGTEIYEGTSEILRVVIARELLARARAG